MPDPDKTPCCGKTPPLYKPLAQLGTGGRFACSYCGEMYLDGKPTGEKVATMQAEESGIFKALKLVAKTDWKSMLLLMTALTGALGFVWNKVELYVQEYNNKQIEAAQTQKVKANQAVNSGAYEALATRLDELFLKVEALETKARVKTEYVPVSLDVPDPPVVIDTSLPKKEKHKAKAAVATVPLAPPAKPEPVSKRFTKARLPEFDAVQAAVEVDLEEFIKEVKAK